MEEKTKYFVVKHFLNDKTMSSNTIIFAQIESVNGIKTKFAQSYQLSNLRFYFILLCKPHTMSKFKNNFIRFLQEQGLNPDLFFFDSFSPSSTTVQYDSIQCNNKRTIYITKINKHLNSNNELNKLINTFGNNFSINDLAGINKDIYDNKILATVTSANVEELNLVICFIPHVSFPDDPTQNMIVSTELCELPIVHIENVNKKCSWDSLKNNVLNVAFQRNVSDDIYSYCQIPSRNGLQIGFVFVVKDEDFLQEVISNLNYGEISNETIKVSHFVDDQTLTHILENFTANEISIETLKSEDTLNSELKLYNFMKKYGKIYKVFLNSICKIGQVIFLDKISYDKYRGENPIPEPFAKKLPELTDNPDLEIDLNIYNSLKVCNEIPSVEDPLVQKKPKKCEFKGGFALIKIVTKDYINFYARKTLQDDLEDEKNIERFFLESKILKKLKCHPCIIDIYGYIYEPKNKILPTIFMEYAENGSLFDAVCARHKSFDDTKKCLAALEICFGMKYIHFLGLIHRDLKLENVLIDDKHHCRITDFGLSREYSEKSLSKGVGSLYYRAPETIDSYNKYNQKCDTFSFGVLLFAMLAVTYPKLDLIHYVNDNTNSAFEPSNCCQFQFTDFTKNLIQKCWLCEFDQRPSFEDIINELKNNNFLITDKVDSDQLLLRYSELHKADLFFHKH